LIELSSAQRQTSVAEGFQQCSELQPLKLQEKLQEKLLVQQMVHMGLIQGLRSPTQLHMLQGTA
jgi:hypothetical protein